MTDITIILIGIGCLLLGWVLAANRYSPLPPATRAAIRKDRRRHRLGLADVRLTGAIGNLWRDTSQPPGWKERVLARIRKGQEGGRP
jgi:hypothetical protein